MFLYDDAVLYWSRFDHQIERIRTDEAWVIQVYDHIPEYDEVLHRVVMRKVLIMRQTLSFGGVYRYEVISQKIVNRSVYHHGRFERIGVRLREESGEALLSFVEEEPTHAIAWIEHEMVKGLSFERVIACYGIFLRYTHLKDMGFLYWREIETLDSDSVSCSTVQQMLLHILGRREKSLRRALYGSYTIAIRKYQRYNHKADHLFSRYIRDRNHLLKLLALPPENKYMMFQGVALEDAERFFLFLHAYYTERSIMKLFCSIPLGMLGYHSNVVKETIRMFISCDARFIRAHFRKVPADIQRLHDTFIRLGRRWRISQMDDEGFIYSDRERSAVIDRGEMRYILPHTNRELYLWSEHLNNCLYGYTDPIKKRETIIYGVMKQDRLSYALEITKGELVQASGVSNEPMDKGDEQEIENWFRTVYQKTVQ